MSAPPGWPHPDRTLRFSSLGAGSVPDSLGVERSQPPIFVGREPELGAVRTVVERARAGEAGSVLVVGDAGQGKTALVDQVLRTTSDALVLQGGCLPLTSFAIPLSPIRSALRRLPASAPEPPDLLDGDRAVALAPVQLDEWLDAVCTETPVVLTVDDLQWADAYTLDVMLYLLAGRRDRRLAVLLTLRRPEVSGGSGLSPWLADVRRLPGFSELPLRPLSRAETLEQLTGLLGGRPHETLAVQVHDRSQGNAYFNRLLVADVDLSTRELPATLPDDLRAAVTASWHRLGPAARQVTAVVALAGLRLSEAELAQVIVAQAPLLPLRPALAQAVTGHVLELAEDGTYWFHHPLQAEVLRSYLSRHERQRWHEAWARFLDLAGRRDAEALIRLADHHVAAGHAEDAFRAALRAADAAARSSAGTEAVRLVRHAIDLLPDVAQAGLTRVDLLRRLRELAEASGEQLAERTAIDELLADRDPQQEPSESAELIVRRIHLRQSLAEDFAPVDEVAVAVRLSARAPRSWQHGYALAEQARLAAWTGDPAAGALAEQALAVAELTGHPRALCYARTSSAMVQLDLGRPSVAVELALRGREAAVAARDFWGYVHATSWATNAVEVWNSPEHARLIHAARVEAVRLGAPARYANMLGVAEAGAALATGDWQACSDLLRTVLASGLAPLYDVACRLVAARLAGLQGRTAEALAHLERAEEISSQLAHFAPLEYSAVAAEVQVQAGCAEDAARTALGALGDGVRGHTMCEWLVPLAARALADLQQAARAAGRPSASVEQQLCGLEEAYPPPPYGTAEKPSIPTDGDLITPLHQRQLDGFGQWYAAEVGRARGRGGNGQEWARAVELLHGAGLPWEAVYAGYRCAQAHLRDVLPDRHAAAAALRTAAVECRRLGAQPVLDRVVRLARAARISLEAPAADRRGLAALTPRENEILAHLVAGRTYREIAEALVLSEKTVSSHISNMLRKTGTANRVELAGRVADPDLLASTPWAP